MNGKQKVIILFAVLWAFVFVSYTLSNPANFTITPATQYSSGGFKAISNMATGYFNATGKQLAGMPKILP